jgi:cytochrome c-type biogenesis protein
MDVLRIPFLNSGRQMNYRRSGTGFFASAVFGLIFAVGWTPCVSAFLGSALMMAASGGESLKGVLMLFVFSLGLGIPFIISAVLVDRLKSAFDFIKRNYRIINLVSGGLLVAVGILMISGLMGYFLSLLTF